MVDAKLNQSLVEIESMINKVQPQANESASGQAMPYSNVVMFAVLGVIILASIVLLVYVVTLLRRPTIHPSRKVVLPPSIRRRIKKPR